MCKTDNSQNPGQGKRPLPIQLHLFPHHGSNPCHQKSPITTLQRHAEKLGGRCLSKVYVASKTKYLWECEQGHLWQSTWDCVSRGAWCHECRKWQSGLNRRKYSIDDLKRFAALKGGECRSERYEGMDKPYGWGCAGGHTWTATWGNILHSGTWCPTCCSHTGERICREFFRQLFKAEFPKMKPEWLTENGKTLLELDGYSERLGVAFEHQGTQHYVDRRHFKDSNHGTGKPSKFEEIQRRDALKARACSERGIVLIQVPSILEGFGVGNVKALIRARLLENHYPLPAGFDQIEVNPDVSYNFNKLEEIRRLVEAKGGQLLTDVYTSSGSMYKVKCSKGHTWHAKGDNLKQGKWCAKCAGIASKTLADVQRAAEKQGGVCLSLASANNRTKLEFQCGQGHRWFALPANVLNKGSWCKACAATGQGMNRRKYTLEDAQKYIEGRGGRFLSDTFTIARRTYEYGCEKGHTWKAVFAKVLLGDWCPHCAGNAKKTIEDLRSAAEARGGSCESTEYLNIKALYGWKCKEGHRWEASADSVLRGSWCALCARRNRSNSASGSSS